MVGSAPTMVVTGNGEESMYSYCCLCILIVDHVRVLLLFVHVFLTFSMYSYCCLCNLIVVYVFLLLSMYV